MLRGLVGSEMCIRDRLSVPRDLWVTSPSGSEERINSAYNDGPQNLIDTIDRNLGISINHYVEVNFSGFKGLVDSVGGVPLYFCLLYTSDAADDLLWVDLGGCRIIKKKKTKYNINNIPSDVMINR